MEGQGWDVRARRREIDRLTEAMDEKGKKLMGIWAQAQVYATLATIADDGEEKWVPVEPPVKALKPTNEQWMHAQAASNFPNALIRIRKLFDQDETEIYEITVAEKGKEHLTRYSFVPDFNAEDPYKLGPSETWRKHE